MTSEADFIRGAPPGGAAADAVRGPANAYVRFGGLSALIAAPWIAIVLVLVVLLA